MWLLLPVVPPPPRAVPAPPFRSTKSRPGPALPQQLPLCPRGPEGPLRPDLARCGAGGHPSRVPGPPPTPDQPPALLHRCPTVSPRCRALLNPPEEQRGPGGVPTGVSPGGPAVRPRFGGCPPPSPPTPRRVAVPLNGGTAPVAEGAAAVADITRGREHLRPARLRHRHRHRSAPGRAGTGAAAGRPRRPPRYAARRTGPADGDTGTYRDPYGAGMAVEGPPHLYLDPLRPAQLYRHPRFCPPHRDPVLPPPPPEPVSLPGPAQRGPAGAA
ncbi:basic proline-rich protein-like [Ammospiza nelsoni]|uniref:basic proline-rich protein-like n=1 Tax=Ammospiza nelsoni TaxID=2857394 RepID=UPI00286C98B3|nr:basic proline-rich protein-like [Ammospiza nelsoni]